MSNELLMFNDKMPWLLLIFTGLFIVNYLILVKGFSFRCFYRNSHSDEENCIMMLGEKKENLSAEELRDEIIERLVCIELMLESEMSGIKEILEQMIDFNKLSFTEFEIQDILSSVNDRCKC